MTIREIFKHIYVPYGFFFYKIDAGKLNNKHHMDCNSQMKKKDHVEIS